MQDKLKDFIQANEAAFDASPMEGHFERFKQKQVAMHQTKKRYSMAMVWSNPMVRVAAMFVVVFGVGWLFYNLGKHQQMATQGLASNVQATSANAQSELMAAEVFFASQLKEKKSELLGYSEVNAPAVKNIMVELEKLELQYLDLKEELSVNSDNQRIISAMVQNYRMRLDVLERLLIHLRKTESLKQKHHVQINA